MKKAVQEIKYTKNLQQQMTYKKKAKTKRLIQSLSILIHKNF